ncbi:hypothetical protein BC781_10193 [Sediminitomix flava]|uniref:DUF1254 domain-containing protein n=2 Tax=Sediminitomix flava TaxID=379075 RepID=A0A316A223_SEDFL|nr:hypothetical protein BC781_10193 [Sediminitomix flava]
MKKSKINFTLYTLIAFLFLGNLSISYAQNKSVSYSEREQAQYNYSYSLGVQAVVYGWAPVMMDVAKVLQTSVDQPMNNGQAPINEFGPITRLWDYRDRSYTTPNNDTFYLQGWCDLEEQPIVIFVPEIKNRYWIMQIVDMYTESVVDLCNATIGEEGGYFVLAKKGYTGDLPENVPVYYSSTRYIWLAGRLGVENEKDLKIARDLQKQFRMMPLNQYPNGGVQPEPKNIEGAPKVEFPAGLDWFKRLDQVLAENPMPEDVELVDSFKHIGIGEGSIDGLNEVQKEALKAAFNDGFQIILDAAKNSNTAVNGWNWEFNAGIYGTDYLSRAAINMNSIGLNSPERAMYPKRYVDDQGIQLNGENTYEITLPAHIPVRTEVGGFWSVTMYDAKDRFMVENEIDRYKIGSMTEGLKRNDDGSVTIIISNKKPKNKKMRANWLPAPADDFMLQFRLYEPEEVIYKGEYELPQLYKIEK